MEVQKIPFSDIDQLSGKDVAYATQADFLRPFYKYDVSLEAFAEVIRDKSRDRTDRQVLVRVLESQYSRFTTSEKVKANIAALADERTFTVVTAHQPALFTGPLYYIFKIISAIQLTETLNQRYPDYRFVPIFISGSEDHDFEEINHARLFGKNITWENDESGAVGLMKTDSLQPVLKELREILGDSDDAQRTYRLIKTAYTSHERYDEATQHLVNELFKDYGLVIMGMNDPDLKRLFVPLMEKELFESPSQALVNETQKALEKVGFSGQAHAREINLFYLRDQIRNRIVREGDRYQVIDTDFSFSAEELKEELHQHPERFSPNVVMRPLYQELILPNLAYIGGGGELAYWLERKSQFEYFGLNYPMLIRRNSALWIDGGACKRLDKLGLSLKDLFTETETLLKRFVKENTENELSLAEEKQALNELFGKVSAKAKEIDPTLEKKVLAEGAKQLNALESLEGRLMRAEKQKHETALNQIRSLKEKLFPDNGLQERKENFLNFYLRYGQGFFETLKEHLNPLEEGFVVFLDR